MFARPATPRSLRPSPLCSAVEPVALAVALVALDDRGRLARHLRGVRLHVDVEIARDALAQVAVQRVLDLAAHLLGTADDQPLRDAALEELEELLPGVLDVVLRFFLDPALEARLRPAALVVPAVYVVDEADHLAHAVADRRPGCARAGG